MDRENRFTAHYYSTPFPYDVERELRQRVLPFVRRPGEVSVDFVLFGFGLWTMRHPDKVDPKRSRLEAFKEGLAKVMKVMELLFASLDLWENEDMRSSLIFEGNQRIFKKKTRIWVVLCAPSYEYCIPVRTWITVHWGI